MAVDPRDTIYLDHAAATPLRPEVDAAMRAAAAVAFANPSSPHTAGRRAKRLLEDCRERVLGLLGGRATGVGRDRLVFTGGATEANVLGLVGLAGRPGGLLLHSARDHGSVMAAVATLSHRDWSARLVPLRPDGRLDLRDCLPATPAGDVLLATTLVCGQTGIVEDMAAIADAAVRTTGLAVHVDATQAVAYEDVRLADLPAATLTVAPHKFGGPRGIGALVVRAGIALAPVVPGPQEAGLRGGTEAVVLAAGFAEALALTVAQRQREAARIAGLRTLLEAAARTAAAAAGLEAVVVGATSRRAAHIATIAFPGIDRQALVMAADLEGVCCATGTACASGSSEPAPALLAAGLPAAIGAAAVRLSLGHHTTVEDVERAAERLCRVLRRIVAAGGPTAARAGG
jgi:cysteine desulfurase